MIIKFLSEENREKWDYFVNSTENATCYYLTGWKDVIEKSFRHKTYYILAEDGDMIKGIVPLVHIRSLLFGNFMVSLPYFNYGGVCTENNNIAERLLKEAIQLALQKGAEYLEMRETRFFDPGLPVKIHKVSMRLELHRDPYELWRSFSSKLRAQIKRPEKEGMFSRFGRLEELDSFYTVFSTNMRNLGTPVYPSSFFKNILDRFPERTWICTVYTKERKPVASGFLVGFRETLEIPWASSLREYNRYSSNMLLYWSVLEFACKNGYRVFDFGRCTPGEGTYRFKQQWGAMPVQLYWHYWLRDGGSPPELNPDNPKYRFAIEAWKRLPLFVTRLVGPHIVKNIP